MTSRRVLIVDDEPLILRALNRYFTAHNWCVCVAEDPIQARDFYKSVDLVISDWAMPEGGGERVLHESPVPVLLHTSSFVTRDGIPAKAWGYVPKPSMAYEVESAAAIILEQLASVDHG